MSQILPKYPIYTDIVSMFRIIFRNLWLIVLVVALGSGLTYFVVQQQPEIYESQGTIIVYPQIDPDEQNDLLNVIDGINYNVIGTYVQILRSRGIEDSVMDSLSSVYDKEKMEEAIIEIRPIENSSVISITVRAAEAAMAKAMADEIALQTIQNLPLQTLIQLYPLQVLDPANLPSDPVSPRLRLAMLLGVAGSSALAIGLAFARESFIAARRES